MQLILNIANYHCIWLASGRCTYPKYTYILKTMQRIISEHTIFLNVGQKVWKFQVCYLQIAVSACEIRSNIGANILGKYLLKSSTRDVRVMRLTCIRRQRSWRSQDDIGHTASRWQSLYTGSHLSPSTATKYCHSRDSYTAYSQDQTPVRSSQTDTASSACLPRFDHVSARTRRPRCQDTDIDQWRRHRLDLMIRDGHTHTLSSTQQHTMTVCWLVSIAVKKMP